jgi:hypothetical protein
MKDSRPKQRVARGYSCLPETHAEIERRRITGGFKSGGKVLDETFPQPPETAQQPTKV